MVFRYAPLYFKVIHILTVNLLGFVYPCDRQRDMWHHLNDLPKIISIFTHKLIPTYLPII